MIVCDQCGTAFPTLSEVFAGARCPGLTLVDFLLMIYGPPCGKGKLKWIDSTSGTEGSDVESEEPMPEKKMIVPTAYQLNGVTFDVICNGCGKVVSFLYKINQAAWIGKKHPHCSGYFISTTYQPSEEPMPKKIPKSPCMGCSQPVCPICAVCESEGCKYVGIRCCSKADMLRLGYLVAQSQKARGYGVLAKGGAVRVPTPYKIILDPDDIEQVMLEMGGTALFVRPCPRRPRHGFVDSRPVKPRDIDAVRAIWDEARAVDPEAELLLCPAIEAKWNAVITPTRLAIGPGNDGATAGHGVLTLPLMGVPIAELNENLLREAGVREDQDPYIEAVWGQQSSGSNLWFFTQLRAGEKIPPCVGKDYVPQLLRVERVLEASGDLVEWEKQAAALTAGTVVVHMGGTLVSHYGVHCLINKVPIFTSRIPEVGEVIQPTTQLAPPDPLAVAKGLAAGAVMKIDRTSAPEAIRFMMVALHNSSALVEDWSMWIGVAATIMVRVGMAASHGEARHSHYSLKTLGRDYMYAASFKDFFASRDTLGIAQYKFLHYKGWGGGFGGKAWAGCTQAIFELDEAIRHHLQRPSPESVGRIVVQLNNAVNKAHNGGWWLNKFVGQDEFTDASKQGLNALAKAAYGMVQLHAAIGKLSVSEVKAAAWRWATAGRIEVRDSIGPDAVAGSNAEIAATGGCTCEMCLGAGLNAEEDEAEDDVVGGEGSIGIGTCPCCHWSGPWCCEDHWSEADKTRCQECSLGIPVWSPMPKTTQSAVAGLGEHQPPHKMGKMASAPTGFPAAAHVRFEPMSPNGDFSVHAQVKIQAQPKDTKAKGYISFDFTLSAEQGDKVLTKLNKIGKPHPSKSASTEPPYEISYSSDAGGYLDAGVPVSFGDELVWRIYEPITGLYVHFNMKGTVFAVDLEDTPTAQTATPKIECDTPF